MNTDIYELHINLNTNIKTEPIVFNVSMIDNIPPETNLTSQYPFLYINAVYELPSMNSFFTNKTYKEVLELFFNRDNFEKFVVANFGNNKPMKLDNAQKERNILITLRYIFALDTTTSMIQNGEETDSIYDGVFSSYFIKHDCVLTLDTKKYTAIQTVWLNDIFNSKPHMNLIKTVHDFIIKFKTPILTKNEYELLNVIAGIKFISSVVTSSGRRNTISAQMTNTSWKDIYEKLESQYLPKSSKYKPSERQIELERVFSILKEIFLNPNFPKIFEKIQNKTKELKTTKTDDVKTDLKQLLKQLYSNLYTLEDIIDKIPTVEPLNKIKIVLQKMKEIREEKEIFDENVLKIKYNSKLIGKSNIIPEDYKLFLNDVQRQESSLKKISNEDLQKKIDAYIKNEDYNDDFVHFVYFLYNNGYLNDNDELKDTVNNNDELKNIFTNIIETGTNTEETKKMLKIGYTIDKNNQLEIQLLTDLLEGKIDDSCLVKNMKLTDAYNKTFYNQPPFSYRFRIHPNELKASVTGGRRRKTHKQRARGSNYTKHYRKRKQRFGGKQERVV